MIKRARLQVRDEAGTITLSETPRIADEVEPKRTSKERSHWQNAWNYLKKDRLALAGCAMVLILVGIAVVAPWLAPYDPLYQHPDGLGSLGQPLAPDSKFVLGTDSLGRDFLSRLLWGGRISIAVSALAVGVSLTIALIGGGVAGYLGGWVDTLLMRFIDLMLSFPALLLQIALATVLPPSLLTVVIVITVFGWVYPARVFRGQVLSLRERPFVEAARCTGARESRILFKHIVPQLWPTMIVYATLRVPAAILTEAGLSFVSLGVRPPTPSWGNLILEGSRFYRTAPWMVLFPGIAIMITVLSFNLLGDGLRDALDPRQWRLRAVTKEQ